MANRPVRIITKRTSVPGKIPTGTTGNELNLIQVGELATNLADKKIFSYDGANIFEFGSNSFLNLSGGTVSGNTNFTADVTASTFSSALVSNTRIKKRFISVATSATPTLNTDNGDIFSLTGLSTNITNASTNLTGTPTHGDLFSYEITDNGVARTITWGTSFSNTGTLSLPTTTVISTLLRCLFQYNSITGKWEIVAVV